MLTFFKACIGLFTDTFSAVSSVDYFKFLLAYIMLLVGYAIICGLSRSARKL